LEKPLFPEPLFFPKKTFLTKFFHKPLKIFPTRWGTRGEKKPPFGGPLRGVANNRKTFNARRDLGGIKTTGDGGRKTP